jgi:hypothetical protein
MPKSELAEDVNIEPEASGPVDLFIGITGAVDIAALQQRATEALRNLPTGGEASSVVVAYLGNGNGGSEIAPNGTKHLPRLVPYSLPISDPANLPWVVTSAAQKVICSLAVEARAKICVLLQGDMALLHPDALQCLISPIVEKGCELVVPVYPSGKFDGLLNHSILAPLTRSLYGKRVRYPLPQDLSCSSRMFTRIAEAQSTSSLLWPSVLAAFGEYQTCQVNVDASHVAQTEGLDLSTVLTSLVGAAYSEMETYAAQWQRVRGSQPTATWGAVAVQTEDGEPIDAKPLVDSFLLGSHNLQEVWGLVLPPVTLLELKKLSRLSPEAFRMPDELWVRIVYDFALAHRLRKISRVHLLGALTPLYLGWVASYVQEVAKASPFAAEQRLEQLARSFEEGKPYLLSRWRWPDRFNP